MSGFPNDPPETHPLPGASPAMRAEPAHASEIAVGPELDTAQYDDDSHGTDLSIGYFFPNESLPQHGSVEPDETGDGQAAATLHHVLDIAFVDGDLETPQNSPRDSLFSFGTPARPFDLDAEDTLSIDFSRLTVHVSPNHLASPTRLLPAHAQDGALHRDAAPIPFDLGVTADLLDSNAGSPVFLMGCSQEHFAVLHGGHQQ